MPVDHFRPGECDCRHNRYSFSQINENASPVQAGVSGMKYGE
ncbi:hypothetical protein ECP03018671_4401 [Escherichia coli P0301867.1]|nr:hypothetical protein ECP03018671_4401 [Escherichia coli P0301867.1]